MTRRRPAHFFSSLTLSPSFESRPSRGTRHSPPVDSVTLKINKGFTLPVALLVLLVFLLLVFLLHARLLSALSFALSLSCFLLSPPPSPPRVPGTSTAGVDRIAEVMAAGRHVILSSDDATPGRRKARRSPKIYEAAAGDSARSEDDIVSGGRIFFFSEV